MVKRSNHLPLFDERFVNYGKNKISWIEHLRYDGYAFAVLGGAYAIDIPHPMYVLLMMYYRSSYRQNWMEIVKKGDLKNALMSIYYNNFLKELYSKEDKSVVYFCIESKK